MPTLASHIPAVPASGIRRIFEVASRLDDVIGLHVGEPDLPVAPHIIEAARQAWAEDDTNYTANGGIAPLRRAIVRKLAERNGLHVDVEQVWVTVGAVQALHQALGLLVRAGDEVLVPDPGYTSFTMSTRLLDAVPVPYTLRPDREFLPSVEELEHLVTDRTRVLIVNSPSNPLGRVFPERTLRELLEFAREHDLWIISDEVYEHFTYAEPHVSIASLDEDDRVFTAFSFSKSYAMTGLRVGYLVTPHGLAETMRTVQETTISCVSVPDQRAAVAALEGEQEHVAAAKRHYLENLEAACAALDARGIRYLRPTGAFYLWVDVSHVSGGDVAQWCEGFVVEQRVALAPGSAFGRSGEGWVRVSLASRREHILEGLSRIPAPPA